MLSLPLSVVARYEAELDRISSLVDKFCSAALLPIGAPPGPSGGILASLTPAFKKVIVCILFITGWF